MRKIKSFFVLFIICITTQCSKEEALPITADFEINAYNNSYTAPAQLVIINKTKGADTYSWFFEGGSPESSNKKSPGLIYYEKEGMYRIVLTASNKDETVEKKEITITITQ